MALAVIFFAAGFALLMDAVMVVVEPTPIPDLGVGQRQDAESGVYVLALVAIFPLSVWGSLRLTGRLARGPNAAALPSLIALLGLGLALLLLLAHLWFITTEGGASAAALVASAVWWVLAAAGLARAARGGPWKPLLGTARFASTLWLVAGVAVVGLALAGTSLQAIDVPILVAGALGVVVAGLLAAGRLPAPPRPGRRVGLALDVAVVVIVALVVIDVVILSPENPAIDVSGRYANLLAQYHQDFILGPANQILRGDAMLVDTASQYGVGSILFVTGWFELAPIGYGMFGLLDGLLTALLFLAGYGILRMAGTARWLAATVLGVAMVSLVLGRVYPVGSLPQEGPLRFGLPMLVVVAATAAARWPSRRRVARAAAFVAVAVSAIWSLEAFGLTVFTFAVAMLYEAQAVPQGGRLRWLGRQAVIAVVACLVAQLVFALGTLAVSGQLPDWNQYLSYLRNFLAGALGDFTYDFVPWSPGLGAAAIYAASGIALAVRALRGPWPEAQRATGAALTVLTAYGVASFGYFVDRSAPHVLAYVALPALLLVGLWLGTILRAGVSGEARTGSVVLAGTVAAVMLASAGPAVGERLEHSALAHVVPGGESMTEAVDRLADFPPFNPLSPRAARELERYAPGEERSLVLVGPDLRTEVLMRAGRASRLPMGAPIGDEYARYDRPRRIREAVAKLEAGDRVLVDAPALLALAQVRNSPRSLLLTNLTPASKTSPLQVFALKEIDKRFRLRPIHRSGKRLIMVELEPRA